jgi:hypothetical protein
VQVPSIPPPIVTNAQPQDVAAKAVPSIQALAPLVHNPVVETPKSENFNETRSNKDRNKGRDGRKDPSDEDDAKKGDGDSRGNSLNIRV